MRPSEQCSRGLVSIITLRNRRILQLATYHGRDLDALFEVPRFSWPNSSISKSYDRGVFSALLPLEPSSWVKGRRARFPCAPCGPAELALRKCDGVKSSNMCLTGSKTGFLSTCDCLTFIDVKSNYCPICPLFFQIFGIFE